MNVRPAGTMLLASVLACGPPPPPLAHARAKSAPTESPREGLVGEYAVTYDGRGELRVEAALVRGGDRVAVESGTEPFVRDFEVARAEANPRWTPGGRDGRVFTAPACATGPCRIRYRYLLREASNKLDDIDVASEEGEVLEAPPSTWLLAPEKAKSDARVRFRVATPASTRFVTGVFRSPEVEGAWEIAVGDLWTAPYSAFGPLRVSRIETPGAWIELAIAKGELALSDDDLTAWTKDAARAIAGYFGRFPLPETLVLVVPSRGRWIGEGRTLSGGGGAIFIRVGEQARRQSLREDWVLVHEMTHLAFPSVARQHDWAEEGLATYVEPFARARAGLMTPEEAWHGLVTGLPNGLPAAGDRGLDRTPTWGRTYWGGALFYLLADIELRKATERRFGLEHALRGILAAGGNNAHRWPLDDVFAAGDRATGTSVLGALHEKMGTSPHPVDLEALYRELGIVRAGATVRFDDAAPLAAIRRALTTP